MPVNQLLQRLATIYSGANIQYPNLRPVTLAQWMLESGRATSKLAKQHYNFGGVKWRKEMAPYATRIKYEANDGVDYYCKFATIENFINGYWAFLNRSPYSGWEEHVDTGEELIDFIGPIYTPTKNYAARVLALVPEAQSLLAGTEFPSVVAGLKTVTAADAAKDLGVVVLDPGHGGTQPNGGSSANNAISKSGVKEKKLTLDFCLILRDELMTQAKAASERINAILTRETDVNPYLVERAKVAADNKADVFLCLHFNGLDNPAVRGCETYFRAKEKNNLNLEEDLAFAEAVQAALFGAIAALDSKAKDRGLKPDTDSGPGGLTVLDDKLLGNAKRPRPEMCRSAYIEAEFITNPAVDTLLVSGPDAVANRTRVMGPSPRRYGRSLKVLIEQREVRGDGWPHRIALTITF
jgi:N-acetylmuramoyl-L-alanine amidase